MRLVFVHAESVALSRGDRALDRDDPEERAATAPAAEAVESASFVAALVAFATVESGDGTAPRAVREAAATAIRERAADLRVDDVVLVPSALLSDRAAAPTAAAAVWDGFPEAVASGDDASAEDARSEDARKHPEDGGFATIAAGFGWRYALDVETKAHPFATAACTVDPATAAAAASGNADATEVECDAATEAWRVVAPDGTRASPEAFVAGGDHGTAVGVERALRAVVPSLDAPSLTSRATTPSGERPPDRADRARALGAADRDPLEADALLRPAGAFVRDRLADAVAGLVAARDPTPERVAGPRAVDLDDDAMLAYAATLGAGGHGVALGARRVLPDALGAATALATVADAGVDATDAPLAVFDADAPAPAATDAWAGSTPASTTAGSRAPAVHEAHASLGAARDAVADHAALAIEFAADCGLDPLAVVTVAPGVADEYENWTAALATRLEGPVLVHVDPAAPAAWPLQVGVAVPTPAGDALRTGVVRLDDDGLRHFAPDRDDVPPVVHAAPAGGLDATLAAVCDAGALADSDSTSADATGDAAGTAPPLPDWLAPTQVRLVPVADDHVDRALAVADALATHGVRADVDDRAKSVGERLARAERDRVPRYVVVGDDETPDRPLPVTDAATGREHERDVAAVAEDVADDVAATAAGRAIVEERTTVAGPTRLSARVAFEE